MTAASLELLVEVARRTAAGAAGSGVPLASR
jgi:hypothetical protein